MDDEHSLQRFVEAQDAADAYRHAVGELGAGRKTTHWMWFVFPQVEGLGRSEMARRYAISSLREARAYLAHPTLGPRLGECAHALLEIEHRSAQEVMGATDAMKLRSSMTLFALAAPGETLFQQVLDRYFEGLRDEATLQRLR